MNGVYVCSHLLMWGPGHHNRNMIKAFFKSRTKNISHSLSPYHNIPNLIPHLATFVILINAITLTSQLLESRVQINFINSPHTPRCMRTFVSESP